MMPTAAGVLALWLAGGLASITEAERIAGVAVADSAVKPEAALVDARRALALTADFEPLAFVKSGKKGEVVEDSYLEARAAYRRHRARLYRAAGLCLGAAARNAEAQRYLRRAFELEATATYGFELARSLVALGRGREALAILLRSAEPLEPEALALAGKAADVAGLPSLQTEIDRARLLALPAAERPEWKDGPLELPERTRLSTGVAFDLATPPIALALVYHAELSCRTCSADLEAIAGRGRGLPIFVSAPGRDQDRALRQAMNIYRYDWPFVVGGGLDRFWGVSPPALVLVARAGFAVAVLRSPLAGLGSVIAALKKSDVPETLPRPQWNRRPVDRRPLPARPALLAEALAPTEEEPAPEAFANALSAYRAGRYQEALRLFEEVEKKGDGLLLPPEARLNRARCLIGLGQREPARLLLLRTGDSRFQDAVDRALEEAGSPRKSASITLRAPRRLS